MLEEAVEQRNPVLHPGMRETVADDPGVRDKHAAAIGIKPHLFREHLGTFRQIRMDPRCDRADRRQIGGVRGTPMQLAHVDPSFRLHHPSLFRCDDARSEKNPCRHLRNTTARAASYPCKPMTGETMTTSSIRLALTLPISPAM